MSLQSSSHVRGDCACGPDSALGPASHQTPGPAMLSPAVYLLGGSGSSSRCLRRMEPALGGKGRMDRRLISFSLSVASSCNTGTGPVSPPQPTPSPPRAEDQEVSRCPRGPGGHKGSPGLPGRWKPWRIGAHSACWQSQERCGHLRNWGRQTSYRGVRLRTPGDGHFPHFPGCFWASQRGGEVAETPGAAEVGAQGMGGGTGLKDRGGGGEQG